MYIQEIYFCSILSVQSEEWDYIGRDAVTPGGYGTYPSDSLVNPTYVRSHMPTDISYTVNVKMWKICTFGNLKNIPDGVFFFEAVL